MKPKASIPVLETYLCSPLKILQGKNQTNSSLGKERKTSDSTKKKKGRHMLEAKAGRFQARILRAKRKDGELLACNHYHSTKQLCI